MQRRRELHGEQLRRAATAELECGQLGEVERAEVNELADQKKFRKKTTFAYVARFEGKVVGTAFFEALQKLAEKETQVCARRGLVAASSRSAPLRRRGALPSCACTARPQPARAHRRCPLRRVPSRRRPAADRRAGR